LARNDRRVNFYWAQNAPALGLPEDNFSVRWSRDDSFDAGRYRFYATADDGIRVYIDGELLLDEWHDNRGFVTYTADRVMAGEHNLVVEYYEHLGDAQVKFWWARIRSGPQPN
jgi:hypothetical protein